MRTRTLTTLTCLALLLAPLDPAFAWGHFGHAVVARIAARELTPAARRQVEDLLRGPAADRMAAVSSVPDWLGRAMPDTKPWHYVNIEIGSDGYNARRDCPDGDCIVAAIARFEATLRDRRAAKADRAEALIWLIHLLGDLHQPLHCADDHDRGGNAVKLWDGDRHTNLHAVWDGAPEDLPDATGGAGAMAADLSREFPAAQRRAWQRGDVADWANETFVIARDKIYKPMAGKDEAPAPQARVVETQLERAGARLAVILNRDLR